MIAHYHALVFQPHTNCISPMPHVQTNYTNVWGKTTQCIAQVQVTQHKMHYNKWEIISWSAIRDSDKRGKSATEIFINYIIKSNKTK